MKKIIVGALVAATVGLFGISAASAAPISSAPLSQAIAGNSGIDLVQYHHGWRHGHRWRRPVCRTVRVCGRYHRCHWVRRCR